MSPGRPSLLLAQFVTAAFGVFAAGACSGTTGTETLAPITGVTVRAESLTSGYGCGLADTQILKYAVVVLGRNPGDLTRYDVPVAGGVYDCFTDGTFVDLPASAGRSDYQLEIYAFNAAAHQAAGGDARLRAIAADRGELRKTSPTYSTTCTAEQISLVQSLAACKPLSAGAGAFVNQP